MYARSTTIKGPPGAIAAGTTYLRDEVIPQLTKVSGFVGLSLLTDAKTGREIVSTAWRDEQALKDSADAVMSIREDAVRRFEASVVSVQPWEIGILHRENMAGESAAVRCTWISGIRDIDRGIDVFKLVALPQAEQLAGFCSASLFVDRASGRSVSAFAFDTRKNLDASREIATQIREKAMAEIGATIDEVAEFDLVISHLRVPETV